MSEEVNNNGIESPEGSSQDGSLGDIAPILTKEYTPSVFDHQMKIEPVSPSMDKGHVYEERDEEMGTPSPVTTVEHGPSQAESDTHHSVLEQFTREKMGTPSPVTTVEHGKSQAESDTHHLVLQHFKREKTDFEEADNLCSFDFDGTDPLEVECGTNKAYLYVDKLCQGSKGKCVEFKGHLLTPNEFQAVSGRETAKDWKRSIRHKGKSLKTLMARGLLKAHPLLCECQSCKSGVRGVKNSLKKGILNHTYFSKHFDDMAVPVHNYASEYSSISNGSLKRARSASPVDDIYDVEQRKLFEMANSPEPKYIESLQRSLASDVSSGLPGSPEKITTSDINHSETAPCTSATNLSLQRNRFTITKPPGKNRKQLAPKHLAKVPHIALTSIPAHSTLKAHSSIRPRYHQQASQSLTIPPGPSSAGEGFIAIKRARSLFTPTSKSPSHVRMIELTRPAQSTTEKAGTPTSLTNGDDQSSYRQSASSSSDTVFLPSEMTNWSVDDVAEFVQSLKGCEDYSQVFREQAIDGEILPVLTEEHLLNNMGLKLGPALKIKINVAKRLGYHLLDDIQ